MGDYRLLEPSNLEKTWVYKKNPLKMGKSETILAFLNIRSVKDNVEVVNDWQKIKAELPLKADHQRKNFEEHLQWCVGAKDGLHLL